MNLNQKSITKNSQSINYIKAITQLVLTLPVDRVVQIYEYAQFLQTQEEALSQSTKQPDFALDPEDDSWLFCSEEEMQAEDQMWDTFMTDNQAHFDRLKRSADIEIKAGTTQPMFDIDGELVTDELTHNPQLS